MSVIDRYYTLIAFSHGSGPNWISHDGAESLIFKQSLEGG